MYNHIKTSQEKEELLGFIDALNESFFRKDGFKMTLKSIPEKYSEIILKRTKNKISQEALLIIKKELEALEEMNVTLSFVPDDQFIEKMCQFIRKTLAKDVILNIQTDKGIIGGIIFNYKGFYSDYSLKKDLDDSFKRQAKSIKKLLNL